MTSIGLLESFAKCLLIGDLEKTAACTSLGRDLFECREWFGPSPVVGLFHVLLILAGVGLPAVLLEASKGGERSVAVSAGIIGVDIPAAIPSALLGQAVAIRKGYRTTLAGYYILLGVTLRAGR